MSWFNGFADRFEQHVPLAPLTWFKLGGCAQYLFRPQDVADLAEIAARARGEEMPFRVLGAGANVLISDDGFDGVVVRLDQPAFSEIHRQGTELTVGAGANLMPFSRACADDGLSGLACMAGIPATLGGAVRMNAGGKFGDISRVVRSVEVLSPDGAVETWDHERIGFDYRHSNLADRIVLAVTVELTEDDPARTRREYDQCFEYKTRSQPMADRSAGCIFKNPPGQSAGALIDQAGLKGTSVGGARVSDRHANFIVTERGATASDVLRLIDVIKDRVARMFHTALETEIEIWKPIRKGVGV
jgi:UDP-N-acetylmuramate dehydrogenase